MTEAWFAAGEGRWIAGLALLAVLAVLEPVAQQGKHRRLVLGAFAACAVLGLALLAASIVGAMTGQPAYVVRPLGAAGFAVGVSFTGTFFAMRRVYAEAELRRTIATDL